MLEAKAFRIRFGILDFIKIFRNARGPINYCELSIARHAFASSIRQLSTNKHDKPSSPDRMLRQHSSSFAVDLFQPFRGEHTRLLSVTAYLSLVSLCLKSVRQASLRSDWSEGILAVGCNACVKHQIITLTGIRTSGCSASACTDRRWR